MASRSRRSKVPPSETGRPLEVGKMVYQGRITLKIGQANVKNSTKRVLALNSRLSEAPPHDQLDIVALQDIPKGFPWASIPGYHLHFCSSRALAEDDNPSKETAKSASEWQMDRVAFLVHQSIPLADWDVTYHTEELNGLAATLCLNTASGSIRIHNVYNRDKELDLTALFGYCQISSSDILLGDFNLHHPTWGGDNLPIVEQSAVELHDLTVSYNMTCQTPRGAVTYSRSDSEEKHCSTIDLTFVGVNIATLVKSCQIIGDLEEYQSDHRPVVTELEMAPYREIKARYAWNAVKSKEFLATLDGALSALGFPPLDSIPDIDDYLERLIGTMTFALQQEVPIRLIRRLAIRRWKPTAAMHGKLTSARAKALNKMKGAPNRKFTNYWLRHKRKSALIDRRKRRTSWRRFIATEAEGIVKGRQKIFLWSRLSKGWSQPKSLPHMPPLYSTDGKQYTTNDDKAKHFMETMWPNISKGQKDPPELKMPELSPNHTAKLDISKELRPGEVADLIKRLPNRKAEGPDKVGNEAFKLALPIIVPFLNHLFQACLNIDYHPLAFRHALTVVLPKAGKKSYNAAKSWRPVALLSCAGKMLEKIIANRIKELLMNNPGLCPVLQFGSPGKSTTHAMEYIINWVYRSWQRPAGGNAYRTSLLSLDISGAYDNVRREELLQRLVDKGFPDWLVRIVWSFLSKRSTELLMPGHRSQRYWVNIGIPQGSPLSPILFILFAAPILESFDNYVLKTGKGKKLKRSKQERTCVFSVMSYVDDTNFLVSSPSFELNCAMLTELHEHLMKWAGPRGVKFGPDKYALMHFLQRKPGKEEEVHIPKIPGLNVKDLVKEEMRILGVIFDRHLRWGAHINSLRAKVSKMLGYHMRISGSTWGPSLIRMRRLHISKMRSIIAYASPAWFIPQHNRHNLGLSQEKLKKLEALHNRCLVKVAGAYEKTDRMVLRKELNIESMEHYIGRISATYRMKNIGSAYMDALEKAQHGKRKPRQNHQNPYTLLYGQAKRELQTVKARYTKNKEDLERVWEQFKQPGSIPEVAKLIKEHSTALCAIKCAAEWDTYVKKNVNNRTSIPAAYTEGWGTECLQYYRHLSRAESSILIQCRTGAIGLNLWLNRFNSDKTTYSGSGLCPCGEGWHTIEHLFLKCPRLAEKRLKLVTEVKDLRLSDLLTSDAKAASRWAILNFGLDQFSWPREELMGN